VFHIEHPAILGRILPDHGAESAGVNVSRRHTMQMRNIHKVLGVCTVALTFTSAAAFGQAFPSKNITLLNALPPSSTYSVMLRAMGDMIQAKTGRTIVIEPVVGAGGVLAPQRVARSDPDGHTIGLVWAAPMTLNPLFTKDIGYDPQKDLAPITMLTKHGNQIIVGTKFPANNLQELIALAKSKPGQIKIGTAGTGSQVGLIQLEEAGGVKFLEVPYKNPTQLVTAGISGEIDGMFQTVGATIGHMQQGQLKMLFVGTKTRSPLVPNVPSISETYKGIEILSWFALVAPGKTPADRIDWHYREWTAALKDPKIADRMQNALGYDIVASTPQELANQIQAEIPVHARIVKQHNITQ